jgi:hypothetical protein
LRKEKSAWVRDKIGQALSGDEKKRVKRSVLIK